jgi:RHS repeat-associated protein
MYDPIVGRFLNPDNYVQGAASTQSYNRYSYCFNNPLKYTDPSGYNPWGCDEASMHLYDDGMWPDENYQGSWCDYYQQKGFSWNYVNINGQRQSSGSFNNNSGKLTTQDMINIAYNSKGGHADFINGQIASDFEKINPTYHWSAIGYIDNEGLIDYVKTREWYTYDIRVTSSKVPMIESSFASITINAGATIVDGTVLIDNLTPSRILPRKSFNNVKASAAAGKLIAKGNTLLTWAAITADGIDIYNNRAMATNADYAKWGTDIGLATAGTVLLGVATFIPGVNVVAWGVALAAVSAANTYGVFNPLYLKLNK